jgi:hypothetical protein
MKQLSLPFRLTLSALLWTSPIVAPSRCVSYLASSSTAAVLSSTHLQPAYLIHAGRAKVVSYLFDAYEPYPLLGAGIAAGVNQLRISPTSWYQGAEGYAGGPPSFLCRMRLNNNHDSPEPGVNP